MREPDTLLGLVVALSAFALLFGVTLAATGPTPGERAALMDSLGPGATGIRWWRP